jgi:hypothetical protein
MFNRLMIATIAAAAILTGALPAEAKTNFDVNIGIGIGGFAGPGYGYYDPGYVVDYSPGTVSCSKARKIVRWNGFSSVKSLDCSAPSYRFSGWKGGEKYAIKVNSWGDITRISAY